MLPELLVVQFSLSSFHWSSFLLLWFLCFSLFVSTFLKGRRLYRSDFEQRNHWSPLHIAHRTLDILRIQWEYRSQMSNCTFCSSITSSPQICDIIWNQPIRNQWMIRTKLEKQWTTIFCSDLTVSSKLLMRSWATSSFIKVQYYKMNRKNFESIKICLIKRMNELTFKLTSSNCCFSIHGAQYNTIKHKIFKQQFTM